MSPHDGDPELTPTERASNRRSGCIILFIILAIAVLTAALTLLTALERR